jgi:hypothetical protein
LLRWWLLRRGADSRWAIGIAALLIPAETFVVGFVSLVALLSEAGID